MSDNIDEATLKKLEAIAKKLGVSVSTLLENKTPQQVLSEDSSGRLQVLND